MRWRPSRLVPSAVYPFPEAVVKFLLLSVGVAVFEILKAALQFLGVNCQCTVDRNLGIIIFVAISLDIRKYVARK